MGLPAAFFVFARRARWFSAAAVVLAVATTGCGPVKRVNPPAATLQRLTVTSEGNLALDVRVQNHSDLATRFGRIEATVDLDGKRAGSLSLPVAVEIAPHSVEIVTTTVALIPGVLAQMRPALDAGAGLRYRLAGTITTEEPDGKYPLEFESRLSPVPGRPGEYR